MALTSRAWRSTSSCFSPPFPFPHHLLLNALPPSDVCVLSRYRRWKRGNLGFLISCARAGVFHSVCIDIRVFVLMVFFLVPSSLLLHVPIDVCHEESRCDIRKDLLCLFRVSN